MAWAMPRRPAEAAAASRRPLVRSGLLVTRSVCCGLLLIVSACAMPARAQGASPVELARLHGDPQASLAELAADPESRFQPLPGHSVFVAGGESGSHWLRLRAALPESEDSDWVLWVNRVPASLIGVYQLGDGGVVRSEQRDFFAPGADETLLSSGYGFPLQPGQRQVEVLLELRNASGVGVRPQLRTQDGHIRHERSVVALLTALYTGLLVLALNAALMAAALREHSYVCLLAFLVAVLLLMLAVNGQLYALPVLRGLAYWQTLGMYALGHVLAAAALALSRDFAELGRIGSAMDRILRWASFGMLGLAAGYLLLPAHLAQEAQWVAAGLWIAVELLILTAAFLAWREHRPQAGPVLVIWLLLSTAVAARLGADLGWLRPQDWNLYGFQIALAGAGFLFSIAQADRIMEFRRQRDRSRQAKEQTDVHLRIEQSRRRFADLLQAGLRSAPPGDLEWMAFRRLVEAVKELLPQRGSAVVAFGYHGHDLLLTEPLVAKPHYSKLLAVRGGTLKGLCRARNPVQIKLDESEDEAHGGMFAVVPLAVAKPGWGGVLVERAPWESFQNDELHLIAEFAQMALAAADEAADSAELKRRAELDPLTGAYNRRAAEVMLEQRLAAAHAQHEPLSVLFLDLDHFKLVNDRHGHAVGDDCLRLLAETVRREVGVEHVFGRYGGEEFILVLAGQPPDRARMIGERIRIALSQQRMNAGGVQVQLTVSIGVAGRLPEEKTMHSLIERADKALYAAKHAGRNQVHVAPAYAGSGASQAPPFL